MSLSEWERRELAELELGLAAEDPGLARRLEPSFKDPGARTHPGPAITVVALGFVTVVAGTSVQLMLVGVLGLTLMVCGSYSMTLAPHPGQSPQPPGDQ